MATKDAGLSGLVEGYRRQLPSVERVLWASLLVFTAGDILSTWYVIDVLGGVETITLSKWALETAGWLGMIAKDAVATVVIYGLWRATPFPYRLSVLLGAALPRAYAVIHNLAPVV